MNLKIIGNLALFALIVFIFSSCTKDNTEEALESSFTMTIDGKVIESDVVANYCVNDSTPVLTIANIEDYLYYYTNGIGYKEGDFMYHNNTDLVERTAYHVLGEEFTGRFKRIKFYNNDEEITIHSITDKFAVGSITGVLRNKEDPCKPLMEFPFTIDFVAEIISGCPQ